MSRTEPTTLVHVDAVEATRVRLPLVQPKSRGQHSPGRPQRAEHIMVRIGDAAGSSGWGEITTPPGHDVADLWTLLIEECAPALLNHPWHRPSDVFRSWKGPPMRAARLSVRAGLDIACWDLWSRRRRTPLSHALGGTRTAITAGVTLARQPSLETLVQEVNRQVGSGFRRIRLEIEPGRDIEAVRAVHDAFPYLALQVDARGRYTEAAEHLDVLRALDAYGLLAIEQPFAAEDLGAHARLCRELRTPVALGTAIDSLATLETAISLEAANALNLGVTRIGGLSAARLAHDRAVDAGWQIWCGTEGESGLGRAALVAMASLPGITLPSEMPGAGGRYSREIMTPPVKAHDGIVPVPLTQPGLGHDVDESALRPVTVGSAIVRR